MPRALYVGFAIVAAFIVPLAASAPVVEDAPVTSPVAQFAERLGLDASRDRARFVADLVRLAYIGPDPRPPVPVGAGAAPRSEPDAARVPVPLSAAIWSRAVFKRTVASDQLLTTILGDRRATLLCRGLTGLDDETLAYLADRPGLVTFLYERAAPWFAAFGESLRIREGRVVAPGGAEAAPLWEMVVRAPLSSPDQFVRQLYAQNAGRLAYVYATLAGAEARAAAFALGLWLPAAERGPRLQVLVDACTRGFAEWHPEDHPFTRPLGDLEMLLHRIGLEPSGAPALPAARRFWAEAFDVDPNQSAGSGSTLPGGTEGPVDAAWLVAAIAEKDMYSRLDRLDQIAFAQRVVPAFSDADRVNAPSIVRGLRSHRMLLLTLERMGARSGSTFAAALRGASAVDAAAADRRFWTLSQFQGALVLVARMQQARTIDAATAAALVQSLVAVPVRDGGYHGGVALWLRSDLARVLPGAVAWEERVATALAGRSNASTAPRVSWEGQSYRLDLALAERQRLEIVREKQGGHTIDLALAIDDLGRRLRAPALAVDEVRDIASALRALAAESGSRLARPVVNLMPSGVGSPRDGLEWVQSVVDALGRITRPADLRRAPRLGESVQELGDIVLGNALVSFAYAASIGDTDGAALLAGNVALRHDFGLGRRDAEGRARTPWAMPRQDFQPGVPWHVAGSLLGLDLALAPLNLRRLSIDRLADAPTLSSLERDGLAVTVGLMEPLRLTDRDRDRLAAAVERGRARLSRIDSQAALDDVADELGFDGWRRRATSWQLAHEPQLMASGFSLVEAFALGGGAPDADVDAWGAPAVYSEGCLCLRFPDPRARRRFDGRPQLPLMAATMGDLNLVVAMMLRELHLPASMARTILTVGLQDFIDEVRLSNTIDWLALPRQAQSLSRRRFEDYVSAAAAVNGPLTPVEDSGSPRNH
jgi:hypothetical protein